AGNDSLNADTPDIADLRLLGRYLGQGNRGLGGPELLVAGCGNEPLRIPRCVAETAFRGPAAMVDRQRPVARIVAVDVEHHGHTIAGRKIVVLRPRRVAGSVVNAGSFATTDG